MKKLKEERAFTLIEMLIVLLIITILILIAIPNVTKHSRAIDGKGCDAYVKMIQSQVEAYKMENKQYPESLDKLTEKQGETEPFLKELPECPDGTNLNIENGEVRMEQDG